MYLLGKKLAVAFRFLCLYIVVFFIGSAIFGAVSEHVLDYVLERLILFSFISSLIMTVIVTVFRIQNKQLQKKYAEIEDRYLSFTKFRFLFARSEFYIELIVALLFLFTAAILVTISDKSFVFNIENSTLGTYIIVFGSLAFVLLNLLSWVIVLSIFQKKAK